VQDEPTAEPVVLDDGWKPVKELRESLFLLVLMLSIMSAYIGLGAIAVRLFAAR
jgi:hypothetical protein